MDGKIEVRAIIEMLGAPKEHIENTLKEYIDKLKKEGLNITSENYAEAQEKGKFFSTFAEIELNFEAMDDVLAFCFDNMPSSVEILSPEKLTFEASLLTGFLNDLQAKIHQVDGLIKEVSAKQQLLDNNALNILHNFIHHILKEGEKTTEEISAKIGMGPKETTSFLNVMIKKGLIKEDGGKYSLAPKAQD